MRNAGLKFVCRDVALRVETTDSPFTGGMSAGQTVTMPVAHHDGNYFADADTLDRLEGEGRIAFRYDGKGGNPNGSARDIAGIFNERRTVLGMMPHPERAIPPLPAGADGMFMFNHLTRILA